MIFAPGQGIAGWVGVLKILPIGTVRTPGAGGAERLRRGDEGGVEALRR